MKKYLVIGNPIEHSLSPLVHNFWFKKYKISESVYEKKKIERNDLKDIVDQVRNEKIKGVNITVPFKKEIIPFLDSLKGDAQLTLSVNTLCKNNNEVIGFNTDTEGFKNSLLNEKIDYKNKKILIIGAGGVSSSILAAFIKTSKKIYITNRSRTKADELKKLGEASLTILGREKEIIEVVDWGKTTEICDIIVNTTSVGLRKGENLNLDFKEYNNATSLFYDLIYNPKDTNFLREAKLRGNKIMNGKMMFLWQAQIAFHMWTGIEASIDKELIKLVEV